MTLVHRCRSCHEERDPARLERPGYVYEAEPCEACGAATTCVFRADEEQVS